jgi:hypothetical protein
MAFSGSTVVPVLGGAVAAAAAALLAGSWPGCPAVTASATVVAAAALMTVALLLVVAVAAADAGVWLGSDVASDRLIAAGSHADGAHRRTRELLDPLDVGARRGRQLLERPERRQVLEPTR